MSDWFWIFIASLAADAVIIGYLALELANARQRGRYTATRAEFLEGQMSILNEAAYQAAEAEKEVGAAV